MEVNGYEWGVDSAQNVTEDLFQCVLDHLGHPRFWGRYLARVENVSEGLTREEIALIHRKGTKLLPIYNSFQEAQGYPQGQKSGRDAAKHARNLGIPVGVPIFADIEWFFPIDKEWIWGWTAATWTSGYLSGFYHDPTAGYFNQAFCAATAEDKAIKAGTILWSAEPQAEPSGPLDPPKYNPKGPDCGGNLWAWQYSRDLPQCPIDTNLAKSSLVRLLW